MINKYYFGGIIDGKIESVEKFILELKNNIDVEYDFNEICFQDKVKDLNKDYQKTIFFGDIKRSLKENFFTGHYDRESDSILKSIDIIKFIDKNPSVRIFLYADTLDISKSETLEASKYKFSWNEYEFEEIYIQEALEDDSYGLEEFESIILTLTDEELSLLEKNYDVKINTHNDFLERFKGVDYIYLTNNPYTIIDENYRFEYIYPEYFKD